MHLQHRASLAPPSSTPPLGLRIDGPGAMAIASTLGKFYGARDAASVWPMLCVHLNITLYALTYWITRPVQPFLFKNLGADAVIFGYLQTTFSVVQLAGSPIIGRLCDTQGSKLALQMCQIATGLSYILLGTAYNIPLLFLAQLPTVLMQSMHCAQAFVSEFSSEESRSNALGRLSLSYGVGMAAGPLLGGYLSDLIGVQNVAICAGLLMFLPVYFNAVLLPRRVAAGEKGAAGGAGGGLRLAEIGRVLENRTCRQLTVFMLLTGLAGQVYHSPPPPSRTKWTRLVHLSVLTGHVSSLFPRCTTPPLPSPPRRPSASPRRTSASCRCRLSPFPARLPSCAPPAVFAGRCRDTTGLVPFAATEGDSVSADHVRGPRPFRQHVRHRRRRGDPPPLPPLPPVLTGHASSLLPY